MSNIEKKKIVDDILELLIKLIDDDAGKPDVSCETAVKPVEMLTIKECAEVVKGLSEHTVCQLVAQDKIKSVRTGAGKKGKILVNKTDLLGFFQK